MDIVSQLQKFIPKHKFFVGIDSDGTVFDSMGIKHKKTLIPITIKLWALENIEKQVYEVGEFINLYSNLRGINRFSGLLMIFKCLDEREDIRSSGVKLPDYRELEEFVNSGLPMSNDSLEKFMIGRKSKFLAEVMEWSRSGDELFSKYVEGLEPFRYVTESLQKAYKAADLMIISAASMEGLKKDWGEAGILNYTALTAGQEAGSKALQLQYAVKAKYQKGNVLLIGDAPGDLQAARENNALFYPIMPGKEEESWKRFYGEAFDRFLDGSYSGEFEDNLIYEFMELLPSKKPWE